MHCLFMQLALVRQLVTVDPRVCSCISAATEAEPSEGMLPWLIPCQALVLQAINGTQACEGWGSCAGWQA